MADDRLEAVRALVQEMERDARRVDPRDAERDAAFAKSARSGDLGPHWRTLQRRIDEGRTSHRDIVSGVDASPEAAAVRGAARAGLGQVRREAEQAAEQSDVATPGSGDDPLPSASDALDDLQARADAVRRYLGDR